mgnify:FL=1
MTYTIHPGPAYYSDDLIHWYRLRTAPEYFIPDIEFDWPEFSRYCRRPYDQERDK